MPSGWLLSEGGPGGEASAGAEVVGTLALAGPSNAAGAVESRGGRSHTLLLWMDSSVVEEMRRFTFIFTFAFTFRAFGISQYLQQKEQQE